MSPTPEASRRGERRRRVLLWTVGILVALTVLAALAIQVVLRGDLPRRRITQALEATLGMDVHIARMRTGWGGTTALTDLTITPPLEDKPMATFPAVEVDHTSVLWMIVTRSLEVDHVRITGGDLFLRQDVSGRWNLQDVIAQLTSEREAGDERPDLPHVEVEGVTVHAAAANGQTLDAVPLTFRGEPIGAVAWSFEGSLADELIVRGRIALDRARRHELDVAVTEGERYAQLWWADAPSPLAGSARWQARFEAAEVRGRLEIEHMNVGDYHLEGPAAVTIGSQAITVDPRGLTITTGSGPVTQARLISGRAVVKDQSLIAQDLTVRTLGAIARLDGAFDYIERSGKLNVAWSGEVDGAQIEHEAQVTLTLHRPTPDRYAATADATTTGQTPWGRWNAQFRAQAAGEELTQMQWQLVAPRLAWFDTTDKEFLFKDLSATFALHDRTAHVEDLRLAGDHELQATGEFNLDSRKWQANIQGERLVIPGLEDEAAKLLLQASGVGRRVEVEQLELDAGGIAIKAVGSYDAGRDLPLDAVAEIEYEIQPPAQTENQAAPQWAGRFRWEGAITGHVEPRDLNAKGKIIADQLILNSQPLHDVTAPLIVEAQGQTLDIRSEDFELLAGRSSIDGRYALNDQAFSAQLKIDRIELGEVVSFVNPKLAIQGLLDAEFTLRTVGWDREKLSAEGEWSVAGFKSDNLAFDSMNGRLTTEGQILRLEPITMTHADGRAAGEVTFNLADGRTVTAELDISRWPHRFEEREIGLTVDGEVSLRSDLVARWVHGRLDLAADVSFRGRPGGKLKATGQLTEDAVTLNQLSGELLNGTVQGTATLDLSDLLKSTGRLDWADIAPAAAGAWWEYPQSVGGRLSGELTFAPATGPRPLEPLRYQVVLRPQELTIRELPVGYSTIVGYIGRERILLHESDITIADGKAELWVSGTQRKGHWHTHAQIGFAELNLDQLTRFIDPRRDKPVPGRVTGVFRLLGPAGAGTWPTGKGTVQLTDSDLVNANILGVVFRIMGVSTARTVPEGEGTMRLSLENKALRIQSFRYFNRGVEALGDGVIEDLSLGKHSPINIFLIGAQRPFKGWDITFLKALDEILAGLQSNLTTVRVHGTVEEPDPQLVPLAALSETIDKLLLNNDEE